VTTAAQQLAEFAAGLRFDDIPPAVRESAAVRVLDTLGCALAARGEDFTPPVLALIRSWGGAGDCTIWGSALTASPPLAALANGCLAHGLDFDDTHAESVTHASAVLVPTVLALAELEGLDGRAATTALVAGYEAITRLGAAAPGRFHERGWHATAVCGAFAAALAAGKCLGLDATRLTAALGIAASQASGVLEHLEDGSWVKRLHPGWAAHSGLLAAGLARGGFTGPATGLEGRFGFYRAALGEAPDFQRVLKNLGNTWDTLNISFKLYPCCHLNHSFIDALLALRREHGISAESVEEIECLVPEGEVAIVCEPAAAKRRPRTAYDAKFSLPFALAAALVDDHIGVGSFAADRLKDERLMALAERVRYSVDRQSDYPRTFPGWVRVRTRNGGRLEARQESQRGGPESPVPAGEIVRKFRDNARLALSGDRVRRLEAAALGLADASDVRTLLALCRVD
jgi:2-methylcitrate dehydratase PrpD